MKNKGRQIEIDIIKGFAVLFMFAVHCYEQFYNYELQDTGFLVHFVRFFGGPLAAPIFMFSMGICMVYTAKATGKDFIKRGIFLFFAGIGIQFVRDYIPFICKAFLQDNKSLLTEGIDYIFGVDIMVFAGIAYIFMGLFKLSRLDDKWLVVFYVICAVANVFLLPIQIETKPLAYISGLLWGSWVNTWFPFCTWIFYPIAGYLIGKRLIACTDKDTFYKKTLTWSALFFIPLVLAMFQFRFDCGGLDGLFHDSYYHHNWFGNIIIFDVFLLWISFWHFAYENLPSIVKSTFIRWSTQLNTMYVVQWILIGFLSILIAYWEQSLLTTFIIFLCVITASDIMATHIFKLYRSKKHA